MKRILVLCTVLLSITTTHAQQYGWKVIAQPAPGSQIFTVDFVDSLHGWCSNGARIYYTKDGGTSWNPSPTAAAVVSLLMQDTLRGWAADSYAQSHSTIFHTSDGGITWSEQLVSSDREYRGMSIKSRLGPIVTGSSRIPTRRDTGIIVHTTNNGQLWITQILSDSVTRLDEIQFIDSTHGWMNGKISNNDLSLSTRGAFFRTSDGGVTWSVIDKPVGFFSFVDTTIGFAYGGRNIESWNDGIYLLRTHDGGISWDSVFIPDSTFFINGISATGISFVDSLNGWIFGDTFYQGGTSAIIIHTTDGGISWMLESIGLASYIGAEIMLDKYHGWVVTHDGSVLGYGLLTSVSDRAEEHAREFVLEQNYPNPFNSTTVIEYRVLADNNVQLSVYDRLGRRTGILVDQWQQEGTYRVVLDARDLSSGSYFYWLKSGETSETKQFIHLK
jgi:photosystem II stability/assembly factor-like uncharacterized protein